MPNRCTKLNFQMLIDSLSVATSVGGHIRRMPILGDFPLSPFDFFAYKKSYSLTHVCNCTTSKTPGYACPET